MLLVTLIIASLTLIERKFLSLLQRRVGPFFVGYRGRLQYIADALKLLNKGLLIPNESNKFWFTDIDGKNIKKLYDITYNQDIRGVVFLNSNLFAYLLPWFQEQI